MTKQGPDENERLREALRDFAQLLPPDRWRLLRPATNDVLRLVYDEAALAAEKPPVELPALDTMIIQTAEKMRDER